MPAIIGIVSVRDGTVLAPWTSFILEGDEIMIDSNGNGSATSIPTAAARRETGYVPPSLVARSTSGLRSAVRAHPYLAAAGIVAVFGLVLTGGLLGGSYRRRSWTDVFTRWL